MFESVAVWADVGHGKFLTKDRHLTRREAWVVCELLEKDGFGGEGLVFPESTEVREINHKE